MWCSNCQQDVPGIASAEHDGTMCCAVCRVPVSGTGEISQDDPGTDNASTPDASADVASLETTNEWRFDDWELDEDLRAAERLTEKIRGHEPSSVAAPGMVDPSDPTHATISNWHTHMQHPPALPSAPLVEQAAKSTPKKRPASPLAWLSLSLGMMAFVCGGVLLAWAFATGRGDLWALGLPLALGGQAAILVGVIFQMDGLWRTNRETSASLNQLDENLSDLRHTTSMLGTTHSSAAQSFYAHMADGANPEMMLADLKGQLDMLAVKMSRQR